MCFLRLKPYRTPQEQRGAAGGHVLCVFCALNHTHTAGTPRRRWRTCAVCFLRFKPYPHGRNNAVPLADMCCMVSAPLSLPTRQEHHGAAGGPVLCDFCALNPTAHGRNSTVPLADMCCVFSAP